MNPKWVALTQKGEFTMQTKIVMRIRTCFIILFILTKLLVVTDVNVFAMESEERFRVLYISSYNQNFETVPLQTQGILSELHEDFVQLDIEYMDTKRFDTKENREYFYALLTYKMKNQPAYDAVILGDDAALQFALDYKENLFSETPLVFLGINDINRAVVAGEDDYITGIIEEASLKDTIEIALKFQPEAKRIVAIVDNTLTGIGDREQFYINESLFPMLKFEDINTSLHTYEEVANMVEEISDDTILLYLSMYTDKQGTFISLNEGISLMVRHANVPIYRQSVGGIGQGILGGKMVSYIESGKIAGRMVYDILNGKQVKDIEVITKSPNQYIFDYDIIKKYNIDSSLIPSDAVLINRELSFYEQNKEIIIPVLCIIGSLTILSLVLMVDNIRRRKFAKVLKENHERLTETYEELAATEEELRMQYTTINEYAENIEQLANHDYLTMLPNRRYFSIKLEAEMKKENPCTIILLDIDDFKKINDSLGHVYGDMLLKEISNRFLTLDDDNFYISRFGGDEFLILIMEDDVDEIEYYIGKIQELFFTPFLIDRKEYFIQLSIGIARYPYDGSNANQLITCADTAMYQAKKTGKNNFLFYQNEMQEELRNRSEIEDILRNAIHEDGFMLLYQPQVCVKTGEIIAFEALLRLRNHNISPIQFIGVAEDTNLIIEIGRIVTRKVIEQMVCFRELGLPLKPISINFSSKQLRDRTYLDFLCETLKSNQIPPEFIEIEITESLFLENTDNTLDFLYHLRRMGIKLSLDDFGTGFSSINYLTYIPVNKIKLDKSLADKFLKLDNKMTMESIILLAHSLNLEITAEGIEEFSQYTRLKDGGCDYIQGYLFSKPLKSEEIANIYCSNLLENVLRDNCIK